MIDKTSCSWSCRRLLVDVQGRPGDLTSDMEPSLQCGLMPAHRESAGLRIIKRGVVALVLLLFTVFASNFAMAQVALLHRGCECQLCGRFRWVHAYLKVPGSDEHASGGPVGRSHGDVQACFVRWLLRACKLVVGAERRDVPNPTEARKRLDGRRPGEDLG